MNKKELIRYIGNKIEEVKEVSKNDTDSIVAICEDVKREYLKFDVNELYDEVHRELFIRTTNEKIQQLNKELMNLKEAHNLSSWDNAVIEILGTLGMFLFSLGS